MCFAHILSKDKFIMPPILIASNVCTLYNVLSWMCAPFAFQTSYKIQQFTSFENVFVCVFHASHLSSVCFALLRFFVSLSSYWLIQTQKMNIQYWLVAIKWMKREEKHLLLNAHTILESQYIGCYTLIYIFSTCIWIAFEGFITVKFNT